MAGRRRGEGCRWLLLPEGFSLWNGRDSQDFGLGVRGWAQLLSLSLRISGNNRAAPIAATAESSLLLFPRTVSEAFACMSGRCTDTLLTPYLTGKDPHHLLGCLRGKPGTLSPSPSEGASPGWSPAATVQPRRFSATALGFSLHCKPALCLPGHPAAPSTAAEFLIHFV